MTLPRGLLASIASLALLAALVPAQVQAFPMDGQRATTGLFYWDQAVQGTPGQIFLHYGQPTWKEEYEKIVTSEKAVTQRLGSNWWTTLDTTLPLTIGQTKVPAGIYYLGLHKTAKGQWQLMLLDPKEVRAKKAHPAMTRGLTAKLSADLVYRKVGKSVDKLTITIKPSKSDPRISSLGIHWHDHFLRAQVEADCGKPKAVEAGGKKAGKNKQ